jgi:hypothetical protein
MNRLYPSSQSMIVRLRDGCVHRFRFSAEGDDMLMASHIEKALQSHDLCDHRHRIGAGIKGR